METLATVAEAVLRRHAAPALRLTELLDHVRSDTGVRALPSERLRTVLESHPDHFRLLNPWRGPWRFVRSDPAHGLRIEPWVLLVADPGDQGAEEATGSAAERRMRESVRWLGITLDIGSGKAVTRWHTIAVAERQARTSLREAA